MCNLHSGVGLRKKGKLGSQEENINHCAKCTRIGGVCLNQGQRNRSNLQALAEDKINAAAIATGARTRLSRVSSKAMTTCSMLSCKLPACTTLMLNRLPPEMLGAKAEHALRLRAVEAGLKPRQWGADIRHARPVAGE